MTLIQRAFPGLAIGLVLMLALWLRLDRLAASPLWLDEAYSGFGAQKGVRFIWTILPTYETHPPFYSTLLWLWTQMFGDSLLALRSLGATLGIATLGIFWLTAREIAKGKPDMRWLVLATLALAAVSPGIVFMARLVRPYHWMIFANAVACWTVWRLARSHAEQQQFDPRAWATYLVAIIALVWLHGLGSLYAAAAALALLLAIGRAGITRHWRTLLKGHALAALAVAPALWITAGQAPVWKQSTWLAFLPENLPANIQIIYGWPGSVAVALGVILAGFAIRQSSGWQRRATLGMLAMALFPVIATILISATISPVFLPRTLVATVVPMILLIAVGGCQSLVRQVMLTCLIGLSLLDSVRANQLPPQQDWYQAIDWLAPRLGPNDLIYAYPNEGALPLRFALRDKGVSAEIRSIPGDVPSSDPAGWYPSGNRGVQSLPPARLREIAQDSISKRTPTIWLLRLGPGKFDPDNIALKQLGEGRTNIGRFNIEPIDLIGLGRANGK